MKKDPFDVERGSLDNPYEQEARWRHLMSGGGSSGAGFKIKTKWVLLALALLFVLSLLLRGANFLFQIFFLN